MVSCLTCDTPFRNGLLKDRCRARYHITKMIIPLDDIIARDFLRFASETASIRELWYKIPTKSCPIAAMSISLIVRPFLLLMLLRVAVCMQEQSHGRQGQAERTASSSLLSERSSSQRYLTVLTRISTQTTLHYLHATRGSLVPPTTTIRNSQAQRLDRSTPSTPSGTGMLLRISEHEPRSNEI